MDIIIVGAGASGLVAAIKAKNKNNNVIVLEKNNTCGKKLLITGAGKCNYFNEDFTINHYRSNNLEILSNYINEENKKRVLDFFSDIGIIPTIKNGYYYPRSQMAVSIQNALLKETEIKGVKIINNVDVKELKKENNKFIINGKYKADKVVIATGSKACAKTGSDGYGIKLLENFNVDYIPFKEALVQLKTSTALKAWHGIRCNAKISLYDGVKFIASEEGELQLTDYGVSGICIFQLSGRAINLRKPNIKINFLDEIEDFDSWIEKRANNLKNRNIIELLEGAINYKLLLALAKVYKMDPEKTYFEIKDKQKLKEMLTEFKLEIIGHNDFEKAQVCQGGVKLTEVNENFELKKENGLYVIGEMLDVDGDCGGYNLGFAFLSAIYVGEDIHDKN